MYHQGYLNPGLYVCCADAHVFVCVQWVCAGVCTPIAQAFRSQCQGNFLSCSPPYLFFFKLLHEFILCVYVCMYGGKGTCTPWHTCGGQKTTCKSWWVGWLAGTFNPWANLAVPPHIFGDRVFQWMQSSLILLDYLVIKPQAPLSPHPSVGMIPTSSFLCGCRGSELVLVDEVLH
jgi:hypothetical protein